MSKAQKFLQTQLKNMEVRKRFASGQSSIPAPAERKPEADKKMDYIRNVKKKPADWAQAMAAEQRQVMMKQMSKLNPKLKETWDADTLDLLTEASLGNAAGLESYAKKLGTKHMDHADFMTAARHMKSGNVAALNSHLKNMDTDPRDHVLTKFVNKQHLGKLGFSMREADALMDTEMQQTGNDLTKKKKGKDKDKEDSSCEMSEDLTPQLVKQGIGIARDKRYAAGNMTGAMRAMDKLHPKLSSHPKVADELKKQNEEVAQVDEIAPVVAGLAARSLAARAGMGTVGRTVTGLAAKQAVKKMNNTSNSYAEEVEIVEQHTMGDLVRCKKTNRLATVQSAEGDRYTVAYADGSTETGAADWYDPVRKTAN